MEIRLIGYPEECRDALRVLRSDACVTVVRASDPYPCRRDGHRVRVYVDAVVTAPQPADRGRRGLRRRPDPDLGGIGLATGSEYVRRELVRRRAREGRKQQDRGGGSNA